LGRVQKQWRGQYPNEGDRPYRAKGHEQQALMEFRTARASFERIGAPLQATQAAQACEDAWIDQTAMRPAMAPLTGGALPATSRNTFLCEGD
jgi:hypothetical protein